MTETKKMELFFFWAISTTLGNNSPTSTFFFSSKEMDGVNFQKVWWANGQKRLNLPTKEVGHWTSL